MRNAMLGTQSEATAGSVNGNSSSPAEDAMGTVPMVIIKEDEPAEEDADEAEDARMADADQKVCHKGCAWLCALTSLLENGMTLSGKGSMRRHHSKGRPVLSIGIRRLLQQIEKYWCAGK